jgi:GT2 family glycosyltransferase
MTAHRVIAGAAAPRQGRYDVDIIILALDRPAETFAAIASAAAQRGISAHITLADQGSKPENLAALQNAVNLQPYATLLAGDGNSGVPAGRNLAASFGHGDCIAALDNDAEFDGTDVLRKAADILREDQALAAIGFRILAHDSGKDDLFSWGYKRALLPRAGECFDTVTFVGAGHAISRRAWDQARGYDETLFFTWEEYDFCLRAINLGWHIRYCGELCIRHKISNESRVFWSEARWFLFVRNSLYIACKWREPKWRWLLRAAIYYLKGLRNGLGDETLRAAAAALVMAKTTPKLTLTAQAAAYLRANDAAHRGFILTRLRRDAFAELPGLAYERSKRSRSSNAKTAGLSTK